MSQVMLCNYADILFVLTRSNYYASTTGLDATQRRLLLSLLDGNTDALEAEMQKVLSDESQVEAARLQFLEAPELAEAMGIPADLLQDADRWAETMAQGADALLNGAGAAKGTQTATKKRTAGSAMKGQAAVLKELLKSFQQPAEDGFEGLAGDADEEGLPFAKRRFAGSAA
jgi:hypothetical protein